jgi:hypothetical protein
MQRVLSSSSLFQEPFPGGSDGDAAAATLTPCFIFLGAHTVIFSRRVAAAH